MYSRGLPGAAEFRRRVNELKSPEEVREEIRVFTGLQGRRERFS